MIEWRKIFSGSDSSTLGKKSLIMLHRQNSFRLFGYCSCVTQWIGAIAPLCLPPKVLVHIIKCRWIFNRIENHCSICVPALPNHLYFWIVYKICSTLNMLHPQINVDISTVIKLKKLIVIQMYNRYSFFFCFYSINFSRDNFPLRIRIKYGGEYVYCTRVYCISRMIIFIFFVGTL